MRSHLRQAKSCKWWIEFSKSPDHVATASLNVPPTVAEASASLSAFADAASAANVTPADIYHVDEIEDEDDLENTTATPSNTSGHDDHEDCDEDSLPEEEGQPDESDDEDENDAGDVFREWLDHAHAAEVFEAVNDEVAIEQAGPGPSTQRLRMHTMLGGRARYLDDDDEDITNERVSVEHATAGLVIRVSTTIHEKWASLFGTKISGDVVMDGSGAPEDVEWYKPFASETDWRVAKWMVDEGIGHNAFDSLLKIPGVGFIFSPSSSYLRTVSHRCERS